MDWDTYELQFRAEAKRLGNDEEYVVRCLDYAKNLHRRGLPPIYDQEHLAHLVGYDISYLRRASNRPIRFYRQFKIGKADGSQREIAEPLPSLKEIQHWILQNILDKCKPTRYSKAYSKGASVKDNAKFHRRQSTVITIDIKDFFPSLGEKKVYVLFRSLGFSRPVSRLLMGLCTLDGGLPQGAPTSPAIANLLCKRIDLRMAGYARGRALRYTRYADDLTLSGEVDIGATIRFAGTVLEDDRLSINHKKTRVMRKHNQQKVTGVVVNDKMQAPRTLRRTLRQEIYFIEKYGLESHLASTKNMRCNYLSHIRGIAFFIRFLNPLDRDALRAIALVNSLLDPLRMSE